MNTIGRNDPCPCGSGKKYKKCCGATDSGSRVSGYDRIRRLDGESDVLLMRFGKRRYGLDALEDAWEEFIQDDEILFDESHPEADFFLRWFTLDWRPEGKEKISELFLRQKGSDLDHDLRRLIESTLKSPFSFFQVLDVAPGEGFTARDILRKLKYTVTEHLASAMVKPGNIMYARIVEMDGIYFMMGCAGAVMPSTFLDPILRLRSAIGKSVPGLGGGITAQVLLDQEDFLQQTYFDLADELAHAKLNIRNSDGDRLKLHTLTYSIPSLEEAFHALKDLEQRIRGAGDDELLKTAKRDASGNITTVHIHWLKKKKKPGMGDYTGMALLVISATRLVVEVNSDKRSRLIQKEIRKRLGDDAVLLKTEVRSAEGIMKEIDEKRAAGEITEEDPADRLYRNSPEVRAVMRDMMDKHWASWPDMPVPALRGMTPRQAAKDPEGRELLESLLLDFETRNLAREDKDNLVDVKRLRRELGIDSA